MSKKRTKTPTCMLSIKTGSHQSLPTLEDGHTAAHRKLIIEALKHHSTVLAAAKALDTCPRELLTHMEYIGIKWPSREEINSALMDTGSLVEAADQLQLPTSWLLKVVWGLGIMWPDRDTLVAAQANLQALDDLGESLRVGFRPLVRALRGYGHAIEPDIPDMAYLLSDLLRTERTEVNDAQDQATV